MLPTPAYLLFPCLLSSTRFVENESQGSANASVIIRSKKENHGHDYNYSRSSTAGDYEEATDFADLYGYREGQRDYGTTESCAGRAARRRGWRRLLRILLLDVVRKRLGLDGQSLRHGRPESLC